LNRSTSEIPVLALVDYFSMLGTIETLNEVASGDFQYLFIVTKRLPWDNQTIAYFEEKGAPYLLLDDVLAKPSLVAHCTGITSIADTALPETARIAKAAGIPHYHSPEVADRISSKAEQRRACAARGVRQPRFCEVDLSDPAWFESVPATMAGRSLVAKPVRGWGSTGVTFIPAIDDAPCLLANAQGPWLIEEEIAGVAHPLGPWLGDHLSVQTMSFAGKHQLIGVMDKPPHAPPFRATGDVCPSVLPDDLRMECERVALAAIDALGIEYGWSHTELKLAEDGPNLLEVNGRMSGTADGASMRLYGSSPLRAWFDLALGKMPNVKEFDYGGKVVCQYIVQSPGKPVQLRDVKAVMSHLQDLPEVIGLQPFWLENLDGDAEPITLNAVMTVWIEAGTPDALKATMQTINAMLREIGLCEWTATQSN
jgi:predicted ATP-grasp superfamily ATP-dependent carboligase